MSEDLYRKFEKNVRKNLQMNFLTDDEAKKAKAAKSRIASTLKQEKWNAVFKSGGKINVADLANVDDAIAEKFASQGLWTIGDVFKAYDDKQFLELATIAREPDGTFSESKAKAIEDAVLAYPGASSAMNRGEVVAKLRENFSATEPDFTTRRSGEIKDYLGRLGLDGTIPFMVLFQEEGYQFTQEAAEAMIEKEKEGTGAIAAPQPSITSLNKIISGFDNFKELAIKKIIMQSIKTAMRKGLDDKQIGLIIEQQAFKGDKKKGKLGIFDQFATQDQQFSDKDYRKSFIEDQVKLLLASGTLVKDPDSGIRASDPVMARYLLSTKGKWARIGKTNNFLIPSIATFLTTKNVGYAKGGQLVFQVADEGDNYPIRMTGSMKVESSADIPKLVAALGTNPKNGFAPLGYEHGDKKASMVMDTFTIMATIPTSLTIFEPPVKSVEKWADYRVMRVEEEENIVNGIPIHMWFKKPGVTAAQVMEKMDEDKNEASLEMFGVEYDDLDEEQKKRIKVPEDSLSDLWGRMYEYGGSLCELSGKSEAQTRLRMMRSDVTTSTPIVGDIVKKQEVNDAKESLVNKIDSAIKEEQKLIDENEKGGTISGSTPACLFIPKINNGEIVVFKGKDKSGIAVDEADYVIKKLDKVMQKCNTATDKKQCYLENIALTQNLLHTISGTSRMTGVESRIYSSVENGKTPEYKEKEAEFKKKLQFIERKVRTGHWTEETAGEETKVKNIELDSIADRAKLLGKVELDMAKWSFLGGMKKLS